MFGIDWTKEIREATAAGTATTIQPDVISSKSREPDPCIGTNLFGINSTFIEQGNKMPNTRRVAARDSILLSFDHWKYEVNDPNKGALQDDYQEVFD